MKAQFAKCSSAEELIEDVRGNGRLSKNQSLLERSISKLDSLNKVLSPYFDALSLVAQSCPEFAAIAWGAVRLALQVRDP